MKAIIVAGGRGERLRPLTNKIPKAMILISGKPILEYTIELMKKNGISELVIALCYLPKAIVDYFGDGSKFGVKIKYIYEDPKLPMGTAGAILPARRFIHETFLVTYADILTKLPVKHMIKFHKHSHGFATINAYQHKGVNFKSLISFNQDNLLTEFKEFESEQYLKDRNCWSNGSFYIFEPEIFDSIPYKKGSDFARDIFPNLIKENKKIYIYSSSEYFLDIGTKKSLIQLEKDLKNDPSILDD